jgi:hypothetical protein
MALLIILQAFFLGWYSGMNHERLQWSRRDILQQGEIERERARNEVLADLVGP